MTTRRLLAIVCVSLGLCVPAAAQSDDGDRLRAQLRQVTLQLRQAQDDQATVQAQKIAADMERDAVKKQLAAVQAELARVRRDGNRAAAVEGDLAKAKDALNQAAAQVQQEKAERGKIQDAAVGIQTVLTACEAKNTKLLAVSREILGAYAGFDFVDSLDAREPFVQRKRVELENLAQDYRDRIEDDAFDPKAVPQPVRTASPPPAVKN